MTQNGLMSLAQKFTTAFVTSCWSAVLSRLNVGSTDTPWQSVSFLALSDDLLLHDVKCALRPLVPSLDFHFSTAVQSLHSTW